MTTQTFVKRFMGMESKADAYTVDGQVWRWVDNDAVIDLDICREYDIPVDVASQKSARDAYVREALAGYRTQQASLSAAEKAEQAYERRAAFGPGRVVVDVFTGKKYRT